MISPALKSQVDLLVEWCSENAADDQDLFETLQAASFELNAQANVVIREIREAAASVRDAKLAQQGKSKLILPDPSPVAEVAAVTK